MRQIPDERLCSFHVGQRWESPRGTTYVVKVLSGSSAVLADLTTGRRVARKWDGVTGGWVLRHDPLYPDKPANERKTTTRVAFQKSRDRTWSHTTLFIVKINGEKAGYVQSIRGTDLFYWYGDGQNTFHTPKTLDEVRADVRAYFKAKAEQP